MSNFRKKNNKEKTKEVIIVDFKDIEEERPLEEKIENKIIQQEKTIQKVKFTQTETINDLETHYNNIKKLNSKLLFDIDIKDKKITKIEKEITNIGLRSRKQLNDSNKEHFKIYKKIKTNLKNYKKTYFTDNEFITNQLNNFFNFFDDCSTKINDNLIHININYQSQIETLNNQYKNQIQDLHNDYKKQIDELKEKHIFHIENIKKLNHNTIIENNELKKDIEIFKTKNQESLQNTYNMKLDFETKLKHYSDYYNDNKDKVKIFNNNLNNNIQSLLSNLKKDRFFHKTYYNDCIYDKSIEYDYEYKKNYFSKIFYDIHFEPFDFYSKSKYISKYLKMIKILESFVNFEDKKFLLYISSEIKSIHDVNYIKNHLNKLNDLHFDLLVLNSNDNYNFIKKDGNLLKVNNITHFDSFIVNKNYASKLIKIISDSINKILKDGINLDNKIEINLNKLLNDKNCYLYYPQFFKNKNHTKTLFSISNHKNINYDNIGYNYNIVDTANENIDIDYEYNGIIYIPERDDHILEIVKYNSKLNYDNLLIINDDIELNHKKSFDFISKFKNTNKILIDNKTKSLFINFKNNYNYDNLFTDYEIVFIDFNL